MTATPIARSAAGMGIAAAVSRAFGAGRMLVIAAVLGTTYLGNTFQAANSVSNVLFELLAAGALSAVLVPTFVTLLAGPDPRDAEEVAGGVLGLAVVALGGLSVAGIALAPQVAELLTAGVDDPVVAEAQAELATFLLRFFMPQLLLYGLGTVATAVLNAKGVFALPAAAPIGNTVVLVAALVAFRALAGPEPGLDLDGAERLCLALGGTLGVAAFVGIPALDLLRRGFRPRLRVAAAWRDARVRRLLALSGWAVVQHAGAGLLLGAAIIVGGGVEGGVVAYQVAFVVFLAPYGILSQPILTTILPPMSSHAAADDHAAVGRDLRWALDALAVVTLPATALLGAAALPVMSVLAFGEADTGDGVGLLAGALAALAVGILPYGAFMLLARGWYALGDSRTPAVAAMVSSLLGVAVIVAAGPLTQGAARMVVLGLAHSGAYLLGAAWLARRLGARVGRLWSPRLLRAVATAGAVALVARAALGALDPAGRVATVASLAVVGLPLVAAYLGALHRWGGLPARGPAPLPDEGTVP